MLNRVNSTSSTELTSYTAGNAYESMSTTDEQLTTWCNVLEHPLAHNTLSADHCNTLTADHCNTLSADRSSNTLSANHCDTLSADHRTAFLANHNEVTSADHCNVMPAGQNNTSLSTNTFNTTSADHCNVQPTTQNNSPQQTRSVSNNIACTVSNNSTTAEAQDSQSTFKQLFFFIRFQLSCIQFKYIIIYEVTNNTIMMIILMIFIFSVPGNSSKFS